MSNRNAPANPGPVDAASPVPPLTCAAIRRRLRISAVCLWLAGSAAVAGFMNPSFESNSFNGWTLEYGHDYGFGVTWQSTLPANHPIPQIVTSATFGNITIPTAPCGTYMAQLNDMLGDAHTTRISQTCTLAASDIDACGVATVTVCWIAALCDPGHIASQQPQFQLELFHTRGGATSTAVQITVTPGVATATPGSGWRRAGLCSGSAIDGFIWYKSECTPMSAFDLRVGDQLTVRMTVRDCTQRAHGGLALLDCVVLTPGFPGSTTDFAAAPPEPCQLDVDLSFLLRRPAALFAAQNWGGYSPLTGGCKMLLATGDFNGDGLSDIAEYRGGGFGSCAIGQVRVLQSNRTAFTSISPSGATFGLPSWARVRSGDFDGDGYHDLLGFNSVGNGMRVLWGGSGGLSSNPATSLTIGNTGTLFDIWVGDFNADGLDDLLRVNGADLEVALARGGCVSMPSNPFHPFTRWRSESASMASLLRQPDIYVADFDGNGRADVLLTSAGGAYLWSSSGQQFARSVLWISNVGSESRGYSIGDFDCDGVFDLARARRGQPIELLSLVSQAPLLNARTRPPFQGVWNALSARGITLNLGPWFLPERFATGDFDGDGRDDVAHFISGNVEVYRSCEPCKCLQASVGEVRCDPNNAMRYIVPVTVTNRTSTPLSAAALVRDTGISINPTTISLLSPCGLPLAHRRSRTVEVAVTGAVAGVSEGFAVLTTLFPPGGDVVTCDDEVCFVPPVCDCMQVYSSDPIEWDYCEPTGSGAVCVNLAVQNTSGLPVCGIRLSMTTPGLTVSPQTICFPPVPTGSSHSVSPCEVQITGSSATGAAELRVELLDCNVAGCDPCACNAVCEERLSWDLQSCPTVLGECCLPVGGLVMRTLTQCGAEGGRWAPPGQSIFCPNSWGTSPATLVRAQPVGDGAALAFGDQGALVAARLPAGSAGVDLAFNAAQQVSLPLEQPRSSDPDAAPGAALRAIGVFDSVAAAALGDLTLVGAPDGSITARIDFAAVAPTHVELRIIGGSVDPIIVPGPIVELGLAVWPASIELSVAPSGHAFDLAFEGVTNMQVIGGPELSGERLSIAAITAPRVAERITTLELRALETSLLSLGRLDFASVPCPGDVTRDCFVNQQDFDLVASNVGGIPEFDLNADGQVDALDLSIVAGNLYANCPCSGVVSPPGDVNCDGVVSVGDIGSFVIALTDPKQFAVLFRGCNIQNADTNGDGVVNVGDISAFVALLTRY